MVTSSGYGRRGRRSPGRPARFPERCPMTERPDVQAAQQKAQMIKLAGVVVAILGVVLMKFGGSLAMVIVGFVVMGAGAGVVSLAASMQRKTLG